MLCSILKILYNVTQVYRNTMPLCSIPYYFEGIIFSQMSCKTCKAHDQHPHSRYIHFPNFKWNSLNQSKNHEISKLLPYFALTWNVVSYNNHEVHEVNSPVYKLLVVLEFLCLRPLCFIVSFKFALF